MGPSGDEAVDLDLFGRRATQHRDWSHRRGEPRGLALGWTLYLMGATAWSLWPVVSGSRIDSEVYRPAARMLTLMIVCGMCVLWPMLRATQPSPARPGRDVARDLLILLIPSLTLLWPQVLLAGWSVGVVGALSGVVVGWGLVIGAWVLAAQRVGLDRAGAAGVVVRLLAAGGPLAVVVVMPGVMCRAGLLGMEHAGRDVVSGWMWTPATAAWEIVRDRSWSGQPAWVGSDHWAGVAWLLAAGAACWAACGWLSGLTRGRVGSYGP